MADGNFGFLQDKIACRLERLRMSAELAIVASVTPLFNVAEESRKPTPWHDMYLVWDNVVRFASAYHENTRALEDQLERAPWLGSEATRLLEAVKQMTASNSGRDYFLLSVEVRGSDPRVIFDTLRPYLTHGYSPMARTTIPELVDVHKTARIMENLAPVR